MKLSAEESMYRRYFWMCILIAACGGPAARAQSEADPDNNRDRVRSLWNPQDMMKQAGDGISKHYNLSPDQEAKTRKLLTERVSKFLQKHDKEIWPLLWELTEAQMKGDAPSKEAALKIAQKGYPIFEDARAEIMRAQDDFRKYLTEQQKTIHDKDLKGLERQFRSIDHQLSSWRKGQVNKKRPFRIRLGPPGTQTVPIGGRRSMLRVQMPETLWERHVRQFIADYRLAEGQKVAATAILQDLIEQAERYRTTHHKDLVDAEGLVRSAELAKPFDRQSLEQARKIRELLNKPFEDYFDELKSRLNSIPTEKQRAEFYTRNPQMKPTSPPASAGGKAGKSAKSSPKSTAGDTKKSPTQDKQAVEKKPPAKTEKGTSGSDPSTP